MLKFPGWIGARSSLRDGAGESFIEVRADKAKTQTRRLVPVKDNLKAWLMPYRKNSGRLCQFENMTKQLLGLAENSWMDWKKKRATAIRCISYRVSECGNAGIVCEESGNSVAVIRSNYLRRVKPAVAAEWFGIMPPKKKTTGRRLAL